MDTAEYSITQCKQEKKSKARDQKINVTIINQNKCYMHALDVNLSYNECNKKNSAGKLKTCNSNHLENGCTRRKYNLLLLVHNYTIKYYTSPYMRINSFHSINMFNPPSHLKIR